MPFHPQKFTSELPSRLSPNQAPMQLKAWSQRSVPVHFPWPSLAVQPSESQSFAGTRTKHSVSLQSAAWCPFQTLRSLHTLLLNPNYPRMIKDGNKIFKIVISATHVKHLKQDIHQTAPDLTQGLPFPDEGQRRTFLRLALCLCDWILGWKPRVNSHFNAYRSNPSTARFDTASFVKGW